MARYAVVKETNIIQYAFGVWHESLEQAKEEAERLAMKEKMEFIILKEVGRVKLQAHPVVYEDLQ